MVLLSRLTPRVSAWQWISIQHHISLSLADASLSQASTSCPRGPDTSWHLTLCIWTHHFPSTVSLPLTHWGHCGPSADASIPHWCFHPFLLNINLPTTSYPTPPNFDFYASQNTYLVWANMSVSSCDANTLLYMDYWDTWPLHQQGLCI